MEGELNVLSGQAASQHYYDLAIRYAQAHFRGDCWWLMRNGKSVNDTLREGESDLAQIAVNLLQKASMSQDSALKERTIFALCYGNLYNTYWYRSVWNSETYKYDIEPDKESQQYAALNRLFDFEASRTPAPYVSRCDEFNTFKKLRNI